MVVGHPYKVDGVADGGVHDEGNVSENTLSGGDNDGMCGTGRLNGWGSHGR